MSDKKISVYIGLLGGVLLLLGSIAWLFEMMFNHTIAYYNIREGLLIIGISLMIYTLLFLLMNKIWGKKWFFKHLATWGALLSFIGIILYGYYTNLTVSWAFGLLKIPLIIFIPSSAISFILFIIDLVREKE